MDKNTDPAVIGALISLREFNTVPSTHPSDRDEIVLTFRRLTKSGVHYNPDIVQKWLLCNGWMKENALNARKIAEYEKQHATLRDHPESAVDAWRKIDKAHRKQNDKTD